jgi:hypothetical protein
VAVAAVIALVVPMTAIIIVIIAVVVPVTAIVTAIIAVAVPMTAIVSFIIAIIARLRRRDRREARDGRPEPNDSPDTVR